jgi:hypothetical protein
MKDEIITICIPTTPERYERMKVLLKSIHENTNGIRYRILIYPNVDGGWVLAVHNALSGLSDDTLVALVGSDIEVEQDWLKILVESFWRLFPDGDGVVEPFNQFHGGSLCQHPLAKVGTIKKYLDRDFVHNFSDNWFTLLAQRDNRLAYVPEAKIKHHHWINKEAEFDETYKTIMATYDKDHETFIRKLNNN